MNSNSGSSQAARCRLCFTALLLFVAVGCSTPIRLPRSPSALHPTLDFVASDYVRVALELGERDPDSLDFAVVSQALRDDVHRAYPAYNVIDQQAADLLTQLHGLSVPKEQQSRAQSLAWQLEAVRARITMLQGHTLSFDSEARVLFQTDRLIDRQEEERKVLRMQIASMLPRTKGSPAQAYGVYTKRFLIPPDRLPAVMTAALAACRQQTLAHLALPANEAVDLAFVGNKPWSAFSRFHGNAHSTIEINVGFPITVDQALELACHEGYPGHHVFNTLRDVALVQKQRLPEAQVQLTFSPQSYLSESAAAYAPRLAFDEEQRTRIERDVLFPLAGLPPAQAERYVALCNLVRQLDSAEPAIAQQYLDGSLEFVRAAQQLDTELMMEHSEATLLYLNEYRSYMLAYTDGPKRIAVRVEKAPDASDAPINENAWKRYLALTGQTAMDLPASLSRQ